MDTNSFSSAGVVPVKILFDIELMNSILNNSFIYPRHFQVSLTNKCNLTCSFCSCMKRNKQDELTFSQLKQLAEIMTKRKTRGVTITGGGEPLLHKNIRYFISDLKDRNIKMGLVSNGLAVGRHPISMFSNLTWARISFSDERLFDKQFIHNMGILKDSGLDLAISYVVTPKINTDNIINIVKFANDNNLTHVRIVWDIYYPGQEEDITKIKKLLKNTNIQENRVIYQGRSEFTTGNKRCLISLLKPMIASNGDMFGCCGVQYSIMHNTRTFPEQMVMGKLEDIDSIIENQKYFDGSICSKCYYDSYNTILNSYFDDINHVEFV